MSTRSRRRRSGSACTPPRLEILLPLEGRPTWTLVAATAEDASALYAHLALDPRTRELLDLLQRIEES